MFSVQLFEPTGDEVTTFVEPGTEICWFHAGSMAKTLEFSTPSRYLPTVLEGHEYKEVKRGAGRPSLYVREEGVYLLIMKSKSPFASDFQRWLAYDVLPAIRKKGSFGNVPNADSGGSEFWQLIDGAIARKIEPERAIDLLHRYGGGAQSAHIKQPTRKAAKWSKTDSDLVQDDNGKLSAKALRVIDLARNTGRVSTREVYRKRIVKNSEEAIALFDSLTSMGLGTKTQTGTKTIWEYCGQTQ